MFQSRWISTDIQLFEDQIRIQSERIVGYHIRIRIRNLRNG
jgi:hypothetical protein